MKKNVGIEKRGEYACKFAPADGERPKEVIWLTCSIFFVGVASVADSDQKGYV